MCPGTDISATVQPMSVKFCVAVELVPIQVFSPSGGIVFSGLQMRGQKCFLDNLFLA